MRHPMLLAPLLALALTTCTEERRPNLLFLSVDTLRADHLGTYGHERPTSPALDALCAEAVVFESAHSSSSWTLPSFASAMTGLPTSSHGCWNFKSRLAPSFTTLAETLQHAGYHTAAVVSHTFLGSRYGLHQGFADYDESLVAATRPISHEAITAPNISDRALALLDAQAASDQPWFIWLHYFDPHRSYRFHDGVSEQFDGPTEELEYEDPRQQALYEGEIAFTDKHIGRVLDRLEALGLADDTVVVLFADHGEEFQEHQRLGHGKTLYREVERIPLAVRAPGIAPMRVDTPVSVIDVMPTVLELLGVPSAPSGGAARSLAPLMLGRSLPPRGCLLELRLRQRKVDAEAFVFGRWKLIEERPLDPSVPPSTLLFDILADPDEQHDVATEKPDVVAQMQARMQLALAQARGAAQSSVGEVDLSAEDLDQLRALGYLSNDDQH